MKFYTFHKKRIGSYAKLLALIILCAVGHYRANARAYVKVVDGDSLEIGPQRVRLLEIDAPEYQQFCFDKNEQEYDCGAKSKKHLYQLLKNAQFKLVCQTQYKDRYKRDLAECFAGGLNLNLEMIRSGWAVAYRTKNKTYHKAEKEAKKAQKGLWQGKFMRPEYYRRLHRR